MYLVRLFVFFPPSLSLSVVVYLRKGFLVVFGMPQDVVSLVLLAVACLSCNYKLLSHVTYVLQLQNPVGLSKPHHPS
jgi:hypothetical protein